MKVYVCIGDEDGILFAAKVTTSLTAAQGIIDSWQKRYLVDYAFDAKEQDDGYGCVARSKDDTVRLYLLESELALP
jgi:hypothetical protein